MFDSDPEFISENYNNVSNIVFHFWLLNLLLSEHVSIFLKTVGSSEPRIKVKLILSFKPPPNCVTRIKYKESTDCKPDPLSTQFVIGPHGFVVLGHEHSCACTHHPGN